MQLWMEINAVTLHKVVETMPPQMRSVIKAKRASVGLWEEGERERERELLCCDPPTSKKDTDTVVLKTSFIIQVPNKSVSPFSQGGEE